MEKTEVQRLSSLTRVMWLVAVGSGLNSLGFRVRVLKGLVCTICCPILSYSNLCCILFWNFLSLRFVLCKGVIMFSIIKIPGKILVLVRTWNSMEWWVWRVWSKWESTEGSQCWVAAFKGRENPWWGRGFRIGVLVINCLKLDPCVEKREDDSEGLGSNTDSFVNMFLAVYKYLTSGPS